MRLVEAQMLVESGSADSGIIIRSESDDGWVLKLLTNKKDVSFPLELQAERGPIRLFKSIDAAVKSAQKIGLSEVKVLL